MREESCESPLYFRDASNEIVKCIGLFVLLFWLGVNSSMTQTPLKTVDHVDLNRYLGKWYEIARLPNRFEKKCQRDITAEYSLDGKKILVHNSCIQQDGKVKVAEGKAKVVDDVTNAKLKVTFFWPFYGDYWIIGLDPEYRWAIVGEPGRKYMWILSRTPHITDPERGNILGLMQQAGYDPGQLIYPQQTSVR